MNILHLLFGFSGRINRAKFWLAVAIYLVVFFGVLTLAMMTTSSMNVIYAIALATYVPLVISGLAVGIKRLHDRDKSAWWLLVFYGVPFVLSSTSYLVFGDDDDGMLSQILVYGSFAINIWALVELGCLRGTIGANQYGTDPLAPQPAQPRTLR